MFRRDPTWTDCLGREEEKGRVWPRRSFVDLDPANLSGTECLEQL